MCTFDIKLSIHSWICETSVLVPQDDAVLAWIVDQNVNDMSRSRAQVDTVLAWTIVLNVIDTSRVVVWLRLSALLAICDRHKILQHAALDTRSVHSHSKFLLSARLSSRIATRGSCYCCSGNVLYRFSMRVFICTPEASTSHTENSQVLLGPTQRCQHMKRFERNWSQRFQGSCHPCHSASDCDRGSQRHNHRH